MQNSKKLKISIISIFIFYICFWVGYSLFFKSKLEEKVKELNESGIAKVEYSKISTVGFPFNFGVKLSNLKVEYNNKFLQKLFPGSPPRELEKPETGSFQSENDIMLFSNLTMNKFKLVPADFPFEITDYRLDSNFVISFKADMTYEFIIKDEASFAHELTAEDIIKNIVMKANLKDVEYSIKENEIHTDIFCKELVGEVSSDGFSKDRLNINSSFSMNAGRTNSTEVIKKLINKSFGATIDKKAFDEFASYVSGHTEDLAADFSINLTDFSDDEGFKNLELDLRSLDHKNYLYNLSSKFQMKFGLDQKDVQSIVAHLKLEFLENANEKLSTFLDKFTKAFSIEYNTVYKKDFDIFMKVFNNILPNLNYLGKIQYDLNMVVNDNIIDIRQSKISTKDTSVDIKFKANDFNNNSIIKTVDAKISAENYNKIIDGTISYLRRIKPVIESAVSRKIFTLKDSAESSIKKFFREISDNPAESENNLEITIKTSKESPVPKIGSKDLNSIIIELDDLINSSIEF